MIQIAALILLAAVPSTRPSGEGPVIVTAVGVPGAPEYAGQFRDWADRWEAAGKQAGAPVHRVGDGPESAQADKEHLEGLLAAQERVAEGPLWLVLIGHGTFDGQNAKFNLRGSDVTAKELAGWLAPFKRPLVIVNCASSSGPFINELSAPGRVIVTATKSGFEMNFARFGDHLSAAVVDPAADLDKDGQTSLLEAFLKASAHVREFYEQEGRLATEQALIDDNGDGRGTPAAWFRGIHPVRRAKEGAPLDGSRAHQFHLVPGAEERNMPAEVRRRRDDLEMQIAQLRESKSSMGDEDAYYGRLEPLLVELARLYEGLDQDGGAP